MSSLRRSVALIVGSILSIVALYFAFKNIDFATLWSTLLSVDPAYVFACSFSLLTGVVCRGWRWRVVAQANDVSVLRFARAVNLGILANHVFPGRLGELIRVFGLVRISSVSFAEALSSAFVDRALDVLVLVLSVAALSTFLVRSAFPRELLIVTAMMSVVLFLSIALLANRDFVGALKAMLERRVKSWPVSFYAFFDQLGRIAQGLLLARNSLGLSAATLSVALTDYFAVCAALSAVGVNYSTEVPLLLWASLAVGSSLPSAPGYVGLYQLAAIWSLSSYGVPAHQAIAVAFVLQGVTLGMSLVISGREIIKLRYFRQH